MTFKYVCVCCTSLEGTWTARVAVLVGVGGGVGAAERAVFLS